MEIKLTTIKDILDFVNLAFRKDSSATVSQGKYIVNASSFLGVCSLDLMKPVTLNLDSKDYSAFQQFAA